MTMNDLEQAQASDLLRGARERGELIDPLSHRWPEISEADGYAIQQRSADSWILSASPLGGYKVLLSRSDLQQRYDTNEPAFGQLPQDGLLTDDSTVPLAMLPALYVEPEVAVVLDRDLHGGDDVADAVRSVVAALELPRSQMDWQNVLGNVLADNGGVGYAVLGSSPRPLGDLNLDALEVVMSRDGVEIDRGTTAAVLGNPLNAVAWLADRLERLGQHLREGQVIMTGSCLHAVSAVAGETIGVTIDQLGSVQVRFTE
jgi:2-keto-4-pentenoate hydratase